MIGGGDQIYNDSIRVSGPLREWTAIGNPKKRREFPFTEKLREACDEFYRKNYVEWYSTEPFASTNGQIPQLNIWDDHDIIDGFGSYVNEFMKCDLIADAPQVAESHKSDPAQLIDTYVAPPMIEPNYIIGSKPGRLTWLENVFSSPLLGPVKFMNRRFGFGGGFFNYFDGNVDLLDDLDDHYTARTHKKERNWFIERLQVLSAEHSVRITILGGDVHLAALGRFYANPDLNIASENDYRFMVNVVSSAITNKPPPAAIANLLARRNKIHHLNSSTDETLFKLFNKDPGAGESGCSAATLAWLVPLPSTVSIKTQGKWKQHKAAGDQHGMGNDGSLDVCIRVEIDQHNPQGKTEPYGLTIPVLNYTGPPPLPRVPHHFRSSRPNTGHNSTTTASS
ncbi:MAG: hypothetical protein STHCBS139747_007525 [Sporothrix thermara]